MTRVDAVMSRSAVTIAPRTTAGEALSTAVAMGVRYLVVCEADAAVGVVCIKCDLRDAPPDAPVCEHMSQPVVIDPGTSIAGAASLMTHGSFGCLPVVSDDRLVGIVTRGDLLRGGLVFDDDAGRYYCFACGDYAHVHPDARTEGVSFCEDCWDRASPPGPLDDLGGGD